MAPYGCNSNQLLARWKSTIFCQKLRTTADLHMEDENLFSNSKTSMSVEDSDEVADTEHEERVSAVKQRRGKQGY